MRTARTNQAENMGTAHGGTKAARPRNIYSIESVQSKLANLWASAIEAAQTVDAQILAALGEDPTQKRPSQSRSARAGTLPPPPPPTAPTPPPPPPPPSAPTPAPSVAATSNANGDCPHPPSHAAPADVAPADAAPADAPADAAPAAAAASTDAAPAPTPHERLGESAFEMSDHLLGEGGYGRVVLGRHAPTGTRVAVKTVVTDRPAVVTREVSAMRRAGAHPNICQLHWYSMQDDQRTHRLVLELCAGGELFGFIERRGALGENETRQYFAGIVDGVRHLHERAVAHRDLKLENVLLGGPELRVAKICDLGLAHVFPREDDGSFVNVSLTQWCGSKSYCAPEILARLGYDGFRADLWSMAIMLFAMCTGFFPVEEATQRDWRFSRLALLQLGPQQQPQPQPQQQPQQPQSTTVTIHSFYNRACPHSASLIALLDSMLRIRPAERLPLADIAASAWLRGLEVAGEGEGEGEGEGALFRADAEVDVVDVVVNRSAFQCGPVSASLSRATMAATDSAEITASFTAETSSAAPAMSAPPAICRQQARSRGMGGDAVDGCE